MNLFLPVCCVCVVGVCVSGGEQELVKTFTSWQVLASWQVLEGGVGGGAVLGDVLC